MLATPAAAETPDHRVFVQHLAVPGGFSTVCGLIPKQQMRLFDKSYTVILKPELFAECGICFYEPKAA